MDRYDYDKEKEGILTPVGLLMFLRVYDIVLDKLDGTDAFMMRTIHVSGCSDFFVYACIDKLVELNRIQEVTSKVIEQKDRVFIKRDENEI